MSGNLQPTHIVHSVAGINPLLFGLENPEIKAITYDLDGTLADYNQHGVPSDHMAVMINLNKLGLWQGILSNAQSTAPERVERAKMFGRIIGDEIGIEFPVITSSDVGDQRKPAVAMFQRAAIEAGQEPKHMAHVGDQIFKDVLGANRAGFGASILVARYGRGDDLRVRLAQRPAEAGLRRVNGMPLWDVNFPSKLERRSRLNGSSSFSK